MHSHNNKPSSPNATSGITFKPAQLLVPNDFVTQNHPDLATAKGSDPKNQPLENNPSEEKSRAPNEVNPLQSPLDQLYWTLYNKAHSYKLSPMSHLSYPHLAYPFAAMRTNNFLQYRPYPLNNKEAVSKRIEELRSLIDFVFLFCLQTNTHFPWINFGVPDNFPELIGSAKSTLNTLATNNAMIEPQAQNTQRQKRKAQASSSQILTGLKTPANTPEQPTRSLKDGKLQNKRFCSSEVESESTESEGKDSPLSTSSSQTVFSFLNNINAASKNENSSKSPSPTP